MKKLALAFVLSSAVLSACTTQPIQPLTPLSPQQVVSQACVLLPGILDILQAQAFAFPASVASDIGKAQNIVSSICTPGATVDATSVASLEQTVLPIVVNAVELSPAVSPQVKGEVLAVQGIFNLVNSIKASQAAAVPVPSGK